MRILLSTKVKLPKLAIMQVIKKKFDTLFNPHSLDEIYEDLDSTSSL